MPQSHARSDPSTRLVVSKKYFQVFAKAGCLIAPLTLVFSHSYCGQYVLDLPPSATLTACGKENTDNRFVADCPIDHY